MNKARILLGVSLAAAVGACGGGAARQPANSGNNAGPPAGHAEGAGGDAPPMPESADMSATEAPASQGPAYPSAAPEQPAAESPHWSAPEPAPAERPGLATQWGETRESHVHDVSFLRGDPERPFALAQIFYNDGAGVRALAAYHGGIRPLSLPVANGAITVSIRDGSGNPLPGMSSGGRTYVTGREGERYTLSITNGTPRRFEAVATVDGLDVINGHSGSLENRGYVLMPWQSLEIDGFRQSEDAVAAFRFSKVGDSYAAKRGEARNVGVIGVAFFAERGDDWSREELRTRDTASPFPSDRAYAPRPW
jgi:hypothetical protein